MPNVASTRWWKVDLSAGVQVRQKPVVAQVDGSESVAVHANLESVVHEWTDDRVSGMVKGNEVEDHVVRSNGIIVVPTGRIRHQQAGSIPMV
jgi:hypothetical protein